MSIPVIIGPKETEKIKRLRAFAETKGNWWDNEKQKRPPGDNPKFVVKLPSGSNGIYWRCVFTVTKTRHLETGEKITVRQLSMSLVGASPGRMPAPWTLEWVGKEFGIDVPREDYIFFGIHPVDGAVHIVAPYIPPDKS